MKNSRIYQRPNAAYTKLKEELLDLFGWDHALAVVVHTLDWLTNNEEIKIRKTGEVITQDSEIWIERPIEQLHLDVMRLYSTRRIRDRINWLIEKGFLKESRDRGGVKKYCLNYRLLNEKLEDGSVYKFTEPTTGHLSGPQNGGEPPDICPTKEHEPPDICPTKEHEPPDICPTNVRSTPDYNKEDYITIKELGEREPLTPFSPAVEKGVVPESTLPSGEKVKVKVNPISSPYSGDPPPQPAAPPRSGVPLGESPDNQETARGVWNRLKRVKWGKGAGTPKKYHKAKLSWLQRKWALAGYTQDQVLEAADIISGLPVQDLGTLMASVERLDDYLNRMVEPGVRTGRVSRMAIAEAETALGAIEGSESVALDSVAAFRASGFVANRQRENELVQESTDETGKSGTRGGTTKPTLGPSGGPRSDLYQVSREQPHEIWNRLFPGRSKAREVTRVTAQQSQLEEIFAKVRAILDADAAIGTESDWLTYEWLWKKKSPMEPYNWEKLLEGSQDWKINKAKRAGQPSQNSQSVVARAKARLRAEGKI